MHRDLDGVELAEPQHVTVEYSYDVVPHDDHRAIYWWTDLALCDYWSPVLTESRGATCATPESYYD